MTEFIEFLQLATANRYESLTELHVLENTVTLAHLQHSQFSLAFACQWRSTADFAFALGFRSVLCLTYQFLTSHNCSCQLTEELSKPKSKLLYDWRPISQYVLVSSPVCCLEVLYLWGTLSDERTGLQFAVQLLNGPRHRTVTILYCLIEGSPNLESQDPIFISPWNRVAQLYPRHWIPFPSPLTTRRATVEVLQPSPNLEDQAPLYVPPGTGWSRPKSKSRYDQRSIIMSCCRVYAVLEGCQLKSSKDILRSTVNRPVYLGVRHPSQTRDQFFLLSWIIFRTHFQYCVFFRFHANNVSSEFFPGNNWCTVSWLHIRYLATAVHVTLSSKTPVRGKHGTDRDDGDSSSFRSFENL
jgi:hypothetical protein